MKLVRYLKYQYSKMLRLKDTPSKVARGVGVGFAMEFAVPIPLVNIFVAFLVARITKVNSLAAVISSTALKPLFPAVVAINLYMKSIVVMVFPGFGSIVLPRSGGTSYIEHVIDSILAGGVPYLVAGLIDGVIVFFVSYMVVYYLLKMRIRRIKHKRMK